MRFLLKISSRITFRQRTHGFCEISFAVTLIINNFWCSNNLASFQISCYIQFFIKNMICEYAEKVRKINLVPAKNICMQWCFCNFINNAIRNFLNKMVKKLILYTAFLLIHSQTVPMKYIYKFELKSMKKEKAIINSNPKYFN